MVQDALGDVRVLDLGRMLAAPYAARMLADFGADVIKVEPLCGDPARASGFAGVDGQTVSPLFICANQNKRSVVIDLESDGGRDALDRLIAQADVLIEDATPEERRAWRLDPADLAKRHPDLIHCSLTPYGVAAAGRAADEGVLQAECGLMSVTGHADESPGGGPMAIGAPIVEAVGGYNSVIGIVAALLARRRRQVGGQHLDLSLLAGGVALQTHAIQDYLLSGQPWRRRGNSGNGGHPAQVYRCRDGQLYVSAGTDQHYAKLCRVLGHPEMIDDPRFKGLLDRDRNRADIDATLGPIIAQWERTALLELLVSADVPCAIVNTYDDVFADPQVAHQQLRVAPPAAAAFVANPIVMSRTPAAYRRPPPELGEHTEEVIAALQSREEA